MTQVTQEKFDEFMKAYPRELKREYNRIIEPPRSVFHDFTLGKPEDGDSAVGMISHEHTPDGVNNTYFLKELKP
jgi:hypothetical protein